MPRQKLTPAELMLKRREYLRLVKVQSRTGGWAVCVVIDGYYANEADADYSLDSFVAESTLDSGPVKDRDAFSAKDLAARLLADPAFRKACPSYVDELSRIVGR